MSEQQYVKRIRTASGDLQIDYNALANAPQMPETGADGIVLTDKTTNYTPITTEGTQIGTLKINNQESKVLVPILGIEGGGTNATTAEEARENLGITAELESIKASYGSHTYLYAGSDEEGGAANSVKGKLKISLNGGEAVTFDGSTEETIDISPDTIGAASADHVHGDYDGLIVKNENPASASLKVSRGISAISTFEVFQFGSGTPSFTNIRPFIGRVGAQIIHCGINLLNHTFTSRTISGITYVVNEDKSITLNGVSEVLMTQNVGLNMLPLPANSYIFSIGNVSLPDGVSIRYFYNDDVLVTFSGNDVEPVEIQLDKPATITMDIRINKRNVNIDNFTFYPMIYKSSLLNNEYIPYNGQNYTLNFGQTVYSGILDWQTGVLMVDKVMLELTGAEDIYKAADTAGVIQITLPDTQFMILEDDDITTECYCSHLESKDRNSVLGKISKGIAIKNATNIYVYAEESSLSVDVWKAFVKHQFEAGTPVQLVYNLAESDRTQFAKCKILEAFEGINTVYSDSDKLETTFNHDRFITSIETADNNFNVRNTKTNVFDFNDGINNSTLTVRMEHNNLLFSKSENLPTPSASVNMPLPQTYFLYHSSSRNLFDKNTLEYGSNLGEEVLNYATSRHIYLHRSSENKLYLKAFKIPEGLSVKVVLYYHKLSGETEETANQIIAGDVYEFYSNLNTTTDPTKYLNSIRLVVSGADSEVELIQEDLATLNIMVSFEPIDETMTYEEGMVRLYRFTPNFSWYDAQYNGTLDYDKDVFGVNYECVTLARLVSDDIKWTRSSPTNSADYVLYHTADVTFDAFTSDGFFCTHYQVVDAGNPNEVKFAITYSDGNLRIYDNNPDITTAEAFKTYLAELNGMIVYKRSTPRVYNITAPNISCYDGMNYLYTSCDEMKVKYNIPWADSGIVYNTQETLTNDIWIDGKPIYRKVFECGDFGKSDKSVTRSVPMGTRPDTIISLRGMGYNSSTDEMRVLPYSHSTGTSNVILRIKKYNTLAPEIQIVVTKGSANMLKNVVVIAEYTKLNDMSVVDKEETIV